jgi:formylglycine-generating enzyme required for sulfatase activity
VETSKNAALAADWPDFLDGFSVHNPVGYLVANPLGLHEVHGNNSEWCFDAYSGYGPDAATDPRIDGETSGRRVLRGGSWYDPAPMSRSAYRDVSRAADRYDDFGVRPARRIVP